MVTPVSVKELLTAGVHFGHRVSRWNPRMRPYIFGKRNLIHIIDLRATIQGLVTACHVLTALAKQGKDFLFVGTKKQARSVIETAAKSCSQHYVTERWIGGTLTNYATVSNRLQRLFEIEKMEADGRIEMYGKKERSQIMREKRKLKRNLEGIRNMGKMPGALVIVDPRREKNAVREANKLKIPVIAVIDTDADPQLVDVPIPANDDAFRVNQILITRLAEAVMAGKTPSTTAPILPLGEAPGGDAPPPVPPTVPQV